MGTEPPEVKREAMWESQPGRQRQPPFAPFSILYSLFSILHSPLFPLWLGLGNGAFPGHCASAPRNLTSLYTEAGDLYQAGKYEEAARLYQQIVDRGVENGAVFYNLGNAYFQQGQLGRAIVNYHRALRYLPRDEDVATNLAYAQSLRQDEVEQPEARRWGQRLFGFTAQLTLNECGHCLSAAYFVGVAFLLVGLFWTSDSGRRVVRYGLGVSLLAGLYWGAALAWKSGVQARDARAVVVAREALVRNGPSPHATVMFRVHDGTEMTLQERRGGWVRVALTPEQIGWVRASEVEAVWSRPQPSEGTKHAG